MTAWTLGLDDPTLSLDVAGGKGASLSRLVRAGFPVPPGYVVTTDAYRAAVAEHGLLHVVEAEARDPDRDATTAEAASARIRAAFSAAPVPPAIAEAIGTAYERLGGGPVAVRSSATAEDLPDLSFAGQQDTYLNVVGADGPAARGRALLAQPVDGARHRLPARNGIPHETTSRWPWSSSRWCRAEVSGVLFTANPLTGQRSETVIDATFGLGEALVSGQVEPDHYRGRLPPAGRIVTDARRQGRRIDARRQAAACDTASATAARRAGPARRRDPGAGRPRRDGWPGAVRRARRTSSGPWRTGEIALLQARPITSLYPLPEGAAAGLARGCRSARYRECSRR